MNKPFDQNLYDDDDNAKHLIVDWLKTKQFHAYINPDQYGIDVLAEKNNVSYGFEVEVKHGWMTAKFPFQTVHFAARKLKFAQPNCYLTMLNDPRTRMLLVSADVIQSCAIVRKQTKYTEAEDFIEVPMELCLFRTL